jgi:hypothetical protein
VTEVIECLLNKNVALNSTPSTKKNKNKTARLFVFSFSFFFGGGGMAALGFELRASYHLSHSASPMLFFSSVNLCQLIPMNLQGEGKFPLDPATTLSL